MAQTEVRAELRKNLFKSRKFKSKLVNIFDTEVEIRQPSLGEVLDQQDEADQKKALLNILVKYCYVPGTNEKLFEEGDLGAILEWPIDSWFAQVSQAVTELTNIDIGQAEGN